MQTYKDLFLYANNLQVNILIKMNIKIRLKQYLDLKGISDYRFQKDIGVTNGYLTKGDTIRSDYLEKILTEYKDLNFIWLLTGEGSMIKEEITPNNVVNEPSVEYEKKYSDKKSLDVLAKTIETLSESEKTNTKNVQELIAQGREQTNNITKLVDLLCRSGIATDVISDEEKRAQFSENDTDENTAYTAGSANVG